MIHNGGMMRCLDGYAGWSSRHITATTTRYYSTSAADGRLYSELSASNLQVVNVNLFRYGALFSPTAHSALGRIASKARSRPSFEALGRYMGLRVPESGDI
jgi:hypothetical protein